MLARCDELTETQLSSLKSVMRANLSTAGIQLSPWDDEEGDEEEEEEEETYDDILPFAIMSPETFAVSTDRGQHRFVRKFRFVSLSSLSLSMSVYGGKLMISTGWTGMAKRTY